MNEGAPGNKRRLPLLPGRTAWARRLSRFSSSRASRASWATRSSTVAGPPGLGSVAEKRISRDAASVPAPDPHCRGPAARDAPVSPAPPGPRACWACLEATAGPRGTPESPSSSPRLHPSHGTPVSGRLPPPGPPATSPRPVPQSRQARPRWGRGHVLLTTSRLAAKGQRDAGAGRTP